METGPGLQGAGDRYSCSATGLQYRRHPRALQAVLMLVIFMAHFQWVVSKRNESIKACDNAIPWDKFSMKTERQCLAFHSPDAQSHFYYWPEDDPHFDHCCGKLSARIKHTYTYGTYGPVLGWGTYYDLGLIDQCLPYWKCYHLYQQMYKTNIWDICCEFTDLQGLYKRRFLNGTVLKHGLLQSAIPIILSLEILVILSIILYWCLWRRRVDHASTDIIKGASRAWLRDIHKTLLMDWIHLCLLAIIGNGLVEAVGHQNPYVAISKSFYNYAQLYVVLTILVWYSSVLHQLSYWIAEIDCEYHELNHEVVAEQSQAHFPPNVQNSNLVAPTKTHRYLPSVLRELEEEIGLSADWKWQPIAAQVGILFCLWGFLTYIDDKEGLTTGVVFGIIVQAACPWSGLYASKVIIHTFPFLLKTLRDNLIKPRRVENSPTYSRLWPNVMLLKKWPRPQGNARAGGGLAQPEDSAAFLELVENESI